jgi:hypothetical protein
MKSHMDIFSLIDKKEIRCDNFLFVSIWWLALVIIALNFQSVNML